MRGDSTNTRQAGRVTPSQTANQRTGQGTALVLHPDRNGETAERLGAALPFVGYPVVRFVADLPAALEALDDEVGTLFFDPCIDGTEELLAAALRMAKVPSLIALSGQCPRQLVFELMSHGVGALLEGPPSVQDVSAALERAGDGLGTLARLARARVGSVGAKEAQAIVRRSMFQEALDRCEGNRHAAARMLRVDRRVVQIMANTLQKAAELEQQ